MCAHTVHGDVSAAARVLHGDIANVGLGSQHVTKNCVVRRWVFVVVVDLLHA